MTPSSRRIVRVASLVAIVAALVGVWISARHAPPPPNVLVITLDTTRADRLSPYGLMDVSMPALERIAREGVVFDQAWSVAPLTLPAHASLFTGVFPPTHGVRDNAHRLTTRHPTMAEILEGHGFRTAAFLGSVVLNADRGLARGFETYREVGNTPNRQRRSDAVVDDAIAWLERAGTSPFFVWAHVYDAHRPYEPPEPYRSRHTDPYVGEIAFADAQIGRLLEALDRRGVLDNTIVVVAGDHGESLGEHGERDHGIFVYESVLRVPLMIRAPGIAATRSSRLVRLVDVMPTLLDLIGIDPPQTDGVSLRRLLDGTDRGLDLEAYAESQYPRQLGWSPLRTLREGRYKVIEAPRPELYDLASDPFERRNLYDARRPLAEAMIRRLRSLAPAREMHPPDETSSDVSPEVTERLAALGYVGMPHAELRSDMDSLPDPKDCMLNERVGSAFASQGLPGCRSRDRAIR